MPIYISNLTFEVAYLHTYLAYLSLLIHTQAQPNDGVTLIMGA